jgi:O-antigen/teichoic acid export membrane protein
MTSAVWSLVIRLVGMVLAFGVGVQLARFLGPAGFGIYGVVLALATMLTALAQLGLPTLAVREIARTRAEGDWPGLRSVLRWFGFGTASAGAVLAALFLAVIAFLPGITPLFRGTGLWAAFLIPVMALTILLNAELRAFDRLLKGQSLEILVRPGGMALLLLLLVLGHGWVTPSEAMAVNLAASIAAMALGLVWIRNALPAPARHVRPSPPPGHWLRAGLPLAATDVLRQLDAGYAVLVMGMIATATETGVLRVATSSIVIVATPLSLLHVVLAPTLARLHFEKERAKLQHLLGVAALLMTVGGLAGVAFIFLFGEWLIVLMFGAEYGAAWLPLLILAVAQTVAAFFGVAFLLLGVAEGEHDLARAYFLGMAASIAAAFPLGFAWGGNGVAAAAVLGAFVYNGLCWRAVRRRLRLDASPIALLRRSAPA